jgi:hypothetical protein
MSSRTVSHVRVVLEALKLKGPQDGGASQPAPSMTFQQSTGRPSNQSSLADAAGASAGMGVAGEGKAPKPNGAAGAAVGLGASGAASDPGAKAAADATSALGAAKVPGAPAKSSAAMAPGASSPSLGAGAQASKAAADYAAELAAVKPLADALAAHPQSSRIAAEKTNIAAKLASAAAHAAKNEWPAAMADLADARTKCVAAKKLADDWQAFSKLRASILARKMAIAGIDDDAANQIQTFIASADAAVLASPPDFAGATTTLNDVAKGMLDWFKGTLNNVKSVLTKLKSQSPAAQAFVAKEIGEGSSLITKAEAALAAEKWSELMMCWSAAWDVLGGAERYGQRRVAYDAQRVATVASIGKVKALPALQDSVAALEAELVKADALASHGQMKMEEGAKVLKDASTRCEALIKAASNVASYSTERAAADNELAQLAKHSAAAQIAEPLKAISKLLADAATSATQAKANTTDPGAQWQTALTQVQRARADLAATKKLADGLGPAAAAQTAAGGTDAAAMRKALTALQADLATAGKAPNAEAAKKPLERCAQQASEADKALTQNNTKAAAGFLQEASKALAEARTIQSQNGQFQTTLTTVEARLAALRKLPTAKAINAKIEAVAKAVEDAKKQDQAAKGEAAIAALRVAIDAAAAADQADADRRAFDTEAKRVADRIKAEVADAKLQKPITKLTEDAAKQADAFNFSEANKTLKRAEVEIADIKLRAGMSSTPPDPKLEAIAKQMVADGGAAAVDKAIQDSPPNNPAVILALASGRFGKPFTIQPGGSAPDQVKALKRICEVFAKVPEDVTNNPSIKDVTHADSTTGAGGGYNASTAHIGMEGRVGFQQDFGNNEESFDPKTSKKVKALPKDIDPDCKPLDNNKIEYMGFAAAHEVGHGVDDKRGFMASKGAGDEYGGWISYGADCQPVADAVGQHIAAKFGGSTFYKTPESKQYTLDKLMNKPATRPDAKPGTPDANALDAFDKWHAIASLGGDPYRRQSDCDAIQIGDRVYHEAYARSWVSYKAAARKKGLTGYQFRSPAEWFAEVYAGWKCGKLGPKHPALKWLNEL